MCTLIFRSIQQHCMWNSIFFCSFFNNRDFHNPLAWLPLHFFSFVMFCISNLIFFSKKSKSNTMYVGARVIWTNFLAENPLFNQTKYHFYHISLLLVARTNAISAFAFFNVFKLKTSSSSAPTTNEIICFPIKIYTQRAASSLWIFFSFVHFTNEMDYYYMKLFHIICAQALSARKFMSHNNTEIHYPTSNRY